MFHLPQTTPASLHSCILAFRCILNKTRFY